MYIIFKYDVPELPPSGRQLTFYLFLGSAKDAEKDGAELLQPTTDKVKYSDGTTEEVYGFDVPVEELGNFSK